MSRENNTCLLLRLEGPMQAWGTQSRFRVRATGDYPSFSGVVGMLAAAQGLGRDAPLAPFHGLQMAVRIDRQGAVLSDYHTVGAKIGIVQAEGKIKRTATTKEIETLTSRRFYLHDASFLVALSGSRDTIQELAAALQDPIYPPFLGRRSCPPSLPVFDGVEEEADPAQALRMRPWRPRFQNEAPPPERLPTIEPASPSDPSAETVCDVPISFRNKEYRARYIRHGSLELEALNHTGGNRQALIPLPKKINRYARYTSSRWQRIRTERLAHDNYLCVFTGLPAEEVHHITYARAGEERLEDLRSLSKLCHEAVTMLEAERGHYATRIDPLPGDPAQRETPAYRKLAQQIRAKMDEILRTRSTPNDRRAALRKQAKEK